MTLERCAYPNCGLTRLSTIHWTDDPNQEIAHGSHEYRAAPAPLDGLTVSRAQLTRWHEALVMSNMPDHDKHPEDTEAHLIALDEMLAALRDGGETT